MLQVPAVQTGLARFAGRKLGSMFGGHLEIGSIQFQPFNAITIRDAVLIDEHPYTEDINNRGFGPVDTVAHVKRLSATLSLRSLFQHKGIYLDHVDAEGLLFQFAVEPDSLYSNNLTRVLKLGSSGKDNKESADTVFRIRRLNVKDARFRMLNYCSTSAPKQHGINYGDMDVRFDIRGHDIRFSDGRMRAVVDELKATEKCGLELYHAGGSCCVGRGKTILKNVHIVDNVGSDIRIRDGVLSYYGSSAWGDFVNSVHIDALLAPSRLVLESISNFSSGTFYGNKFTADVQSLHFEGTVSDFAASNFVFSTPYGPRGNADVAIKGIPHMQDAAVSGKLDNVYFTFEGLQNALAAWGANVAVGKLAPGTEFRLKAAADGLFSNLKAGVLLSSDIGGLTANAHARNLLTKGKNMEVRADIHGKEFDLGSFLSSKTLGKSTFAAHADASLGSAGKSVKLDKMDIAKLGLMDYDYSGLHLTGSFVNGDITAELHSDDPNASLDFEGAFGLKDKRGRFNAELLYVDLAAMNIDTRGGQSVVSCSISSEQGLSSRLPLNIQVSDLQFINDDGVHWIGDINAEARIDGEHATVILGSDVLDAKYNGSSDFSSLIKYARGITVEKSLPEFFAAGGVAPEIAPEGPEATLSAVFHDTKGMLAFVMPGLAIARNTTLNLDLDGTGTVLGYISSPSLAYNGISAKNLELAIDNQDETLNCTVNADLLKVNNMAFNTARIGLEAADNRATLGVNYEGSDLLDKGSELNLTALLARDEKGRPSMDLNTLQSFLRIKNDVWELQESDIAMHGGEIDVNGFRLASETQSISIDGGIMPHRKDSLLVDISNLSLDIVNDFLDDSKPKLKGIMDGYITLLSPLPSEMGLAADLSIKGLEVDGKSAGDVKVLSEWDDAARRIDLQLDNEKDGREALQLTGSYWVKGKKVDATAVFDNFSVAPAAPFLKSYLSEFDGNLNGSIKATGPADKLKFESEDLNLDKVRTRVVYTNVAYTLDGSIGVNENGLTFNRIAVTDDYGGTGVLNGGLAFKELKDFRMDATLFMRGLKAIDIPDPDSRIMVYGDLALSGISKISGPFNSLYVDAEVVTSGSGNVNVPLSGASTAHGSDLLTFTQPLPEISEDDEEPALPKAGQGSSSKFVAHAKVNLRPDVIANVEIDKESGHVLTAGGNGEVVVDLNTGKGKLQLKGDYNIDKGKYLFNIPGIVSKEFDIKNGSSIKFNGDVKESTLDINAIHNVKTSLSTLVADTTNVSTRRNVECGIKVGGKLTSPDVSFSIDVPDLDPSTKMQVDAALSTQDKIQKQFVALLLFGTFLPEEGSGVVNGTNMIISNVGEIVSSQLNNILQKLDIPLDFGLGYQQDNVGTDIFDVAVSTQLFNNRVVVNGSVGNRKYSTSKNTNGDFVGDLDIEVKMDKSGELRLKLFSHSADEFSSSLDFSQRNGVGVSYQKEFDHFKDFFRQMFMSRKRKTEEALAESRRKREMKTITIEN